MNSVYDIFPYIIKKKFFLLFFCFFFGCDVYTVQNGFNERIIAGSFVIMPGQCMEFIDLPLFGDFPIKFKYQNNDLISEKAYPPENYLVSEKADIVEQGTRCKMEEVGKKPENEADKNSADPDSKSKDIDDSSSGWTIEDSQRQDVSP